MSQEIRHVGMGADNSILRATDHADAPQLIAKHVMNLHMNRPNTGGESGDAEGEINLDKMKRYIAYCKSYVEADVYADVVGPLTTCPCEQKMRTSAVARSTRNAEQPLCGVEKASATGGTGQR